MTGLRSLCAGAAALALTACADATRPLPAATSSRSATSEPRPPSPLPAPATAPSPRKGTVVPLVDALSVATVDAIDATGQMPDAVLGEEPSSRFPAGTLFIGAVDRRYGPVVVEWDVAREETIRRVAPGPGGECGAVRVALAHAGGSVFVAVAGVGGSGSLTALDRDLRARRTIPLADDTTQLSLASDGRYVAILREAGPKRDRVMKERLTLLTADTLEVVAHTELEGGVLSSLSTKRALAFHAGRLFHAEQGKLIGSAIQALDLPGLQIVSTRTSAADGFSEAPLAVRQGQLVWHDHGRELTLTRDLQVIRACKVGDPGDAIGPRGEVLTPRGWSISGATWRFTPDLDALLGVPDPSTYSGGVECTATFAGEQPLLVCGDPGLHVIRLPRATRGEGKRARCTPTRGPSPRAHRSP